MASVEVTSRSSEVGLPARAISAFYLYMNILLRGSVVRDVLHSVTKSNCIVDINYAVLWSNECENVRFLMFIYRRTRDYFVWSSIHTRNCQFIRRQWSNSTKDEKGTSCLHTFML